MEEDLPSYQTAFETRPPLECPPPKPTTPCHAITIERTHQPKSNQSSSEYPCSTASSKSVLKEQTARKKPAPPASKPLLALSSNAPNSFWPASNEKFLSAVTAHHDTIATLRYAVKDIVCKAVTTTQDAITKFGNESNKHLLTIKRTASELIPERLEKAKSECSTALERVGNDKNRFKFFYVDSSDKSSTVAQANNTINLILQKVDSALSIVSDVCTYTWKPKNFNDQSSEYDVPTPRPSECPCPKEIENTRHPGNLHLFSKVKDKVWSMVTEDDRASISSSTTTLASEIDDEFLCTMTV